MEEDCVIIEASQEVQERRKQFTSVSPNSFCNLGSVEAISCLHQMIPYQCCHCSENAIASSSIVSGPARRLVVIYQYYCQKHLLVELKKAKECENEKEFTLLGCSFCKRMNLSICSNCFIIFHSPWYNATVYCRLCQK